MYGHLRRCGILLMLYAKRMIHSFIAVLVGSAQSMIPELVERASKLSVNGGFEKNADLCVIIFLHPGLL